MVSVWRLLSFLVKVWSPTLNLEIPELISTTPTGHRKSIGPFPSKLVKRWSTYFLPLHPLLYHINLNIFNSNRSDPIQYYTMSCPVKKKISISSDLGKYSSYKMSPIDNTETYHILQRVNHILLSRVKKGPVAGLNNSKIAKNWARLIAISF